MYGSNASILSRGEIKRFSQQRGWYVVLKLLSLVISVTLIIVLIWLRIDWGITNWAHHAYFSHFWSGVYIIFAGCCVTAVDSLLGCCSAVNVSPRLIILSGVLSFASLLLLLVGSACMLTDALGKPVQYITDLILNLLNINYTNNVVANENFLDNMYRIVGCCGANGERDYHDMDRSPPNSCVDKYHIGGIFFSRGCGYGFSIYMKTWAGCVAAATAVFCCLQIVTITISYLMIQFVKKSAKVEKLQVAYDSKPLPPEPDVIQRKISGDSYETNHYDLPPPVTYRHESLQTAEVTNKANRYSESPGSMFVDTRRFSLRQSHVEEEIPLKSVNPRGENLKRAGSMEVYLEPQIGRSRAGSTVSFSGNKLKYQSEIRNLIRSYQDLGNNPDDLTSDSEIEGNYQDEYESLNKEEKTVKTNRYEQKPVKSVLFGSNTINQKIHEEFKLKAKRNESFKKALHSPNSKRRATLKQNIKRSMEDLHEGFKSISRTNSINSIRSLERTGSQASIGQLRRGSGSYGTGSTGKRQSEPFIQSKQKSQERVMQKQGPLNKNLKNDLISRSSAGLDILAKGLGPRKASRERIIQKKLVANTQENIDEDAGIQSQRNRGRQSPKTSGGRQSPKASRSKDNLAGSSSREDLDKSTKQSFAGEFVDFYLGKRKT